jgi:hypothetical protein
MIRVANEINVNGNCASGANERTHSSECSGSGNPSKPFWYPASTSESSVLSAANIAWS